MRRLLIFGLAALAISAAPAWRSAPTIATRLEVLPSGLLGQPSQPQSIGDPVGQLEAAEPAPSADSAMETAAALEPVEAEPAVEPTPQAPPEPTFIQLSGGTTVTPEHFYSTTLAKGTWYEVILPPGYEHSNRRYPVLYMLHGAAGGAGEWVEIGLHKAADILWSESAYQPFIIVLPDGDGSSYFLNHADGGPRYGDYIAGDVVEEIDATYRTLPSPEFRAIGGLSMGGDGALQLALHHPDIFGIVGAHSPTTRLTYDAIPGPFYGDEAYWQENNPVWLIENTDAASKLKIWIDMGEDDVWIPSARALRDALDEQGVTEYVYSEFEGTHEAEYWEAYQADYLRFYARAFGVALEARDKRTGPGLAASIH